MQTLYIVATPIGNLADMSERAIETLKSVAIILAEDTRVSKKLLQHFGINTPMMALHEHNEVPMTDKVLSLLADKDLALISDAGTPLISDPGFKLIRTLKQHNINIVPIPGACALISVLSASGLPTDDFRFCGFLPATNNKRLKRLSLLINESATLVFYESPRRAKDCIKAMCEQFGTNRMACIGREITKLHEEILTMTLGELYDFFTNDKITEKGEFVIIVEGNKTKITAETIEIQRILRLLSENMSKKTAILMTSQIMNVPKNKIYQLSLKN